MSSRDFPRPAHDGLKKKRNYFAGLRCSFGDRGSCLSFYRPSNQLFVSCPSVHNHFVSSKCFGEYDDGAPEKIQAGRCRPNDPAYHAGCYQPRLARALGGRHLLRRSQPAVGHRRCRNDRRILAKAVATPTRLTKLSPRPRRIFGGRGACFSSVLGARGASRVSPVRSTGSEGNGPERRKCGTRPRRSSIFYRRPPTETQA